MPPEEFEALLRRELAQRDARRRARLGDEPAKAAADQGLVTAVMEAAGYGGPSPEAERTVRRARRGARANEDKAFGADL
jgi:hypothetical protein